MRKISYAAIVFAGLASLGTVYGYERHWLHLIGLPLDDTYIHLQFVKNLLKGHWFVYNLGQKPTPGDTSPLWVILIAAGGLFSKNLLAISLVLSGIFYLLTGLTAYRLGEKILDDKWFALVYGLAVIFTGRLVWAGASGMETTLFSFLSLLAVLVFLRDKARGRLSVLSGAIFGLAANARPEGNLLFILALFDWIVLEQILRQRKFRLGSIPWAAGLVYALLALPYPLFCYFTTGHAVPNSYRALRSPLEVHHLGRYFHSLLYYWSMDNLPAYLLLPFGIGLFLSRRLRGAPKEQAGFLVWLWPCVFLPANFRASPYTYEFHRYLIPVLPFFMLLGFYGWERVLEKAREKIPALKGLGWKVAIGFCLIAWGAVLTLKYWPRATAICAQNIQDMQVKIGTMVKAKTAPGDLIAANDIGAIFYISDRPVLDLVGLVTPELLDRMENPALLKQGLEPILMSYLAEKKPAYLIIFPNWYPGLAADRIHFQEVYSAALDYNLICGGDRMVVYKCNW